MSGHEAAHGKEEALSEEERVQRTVSFVVWGTAALALVGVEALITNHEDASWMRHFAYRALETGMLGTLAAALLGVPVPTRLPEIRLPRIELPEIKLPRLWGRRRPQGHDVLMDDEVEDDEGYRYGGRYTLLETHDIQELLRQDEEDDY